MGSQLFVGFGALLVLTVLFGVVLVHVLPVQVRVERRVSTDLMSVGERARVSLTPTVRSLVPVHVWWRDAGGEGLSRAAHGVTKLQARVQTPLAYEFTALARGRYELGPVSFTLEDPFGFSHRVFRTEATSEVFVAPRIGPWPLGQPGSASGSAESGPHNLADASAVDVIPRPFHPGDSVRRVHWRATARSGELMVRQDIAEMSPQMHVVIDLHRAHWMHGRRRGTGLPAFERAVEVGAAIAVGAVQRGYDVTVADERGTPIEALDGSPDATRSLLRTIATVMPTHETVGDWAMYTAPPSAITVLAGYLTVEDARRLAGVRHRATRTVFTPDPTSEVTDTLTRAGWTVVPLDASHLSDPWMTGAIR